MKTVYELALPALAEIGISEVFARTKDRNHKTDDGHMHVSDQVAADVEVGVEELGVTHHQGAEEDHEVGGAHLGRLEIKRTADHSPVVQRVEFFNRDARRKRNDGALAVRNSALRKPVLHVLSAHIATDGSSQSAGAAVVKVEGSLDARFLAHGLPRVAK